MKKLTRPEIESMILASFNTHMLNPFSPRLRFEDCDFNEMSLQSLDMRCIVDFDNCSFVGADLSNCDISRCKFTGCELTDVYLNFTDCWMAIFEHCNLSSADLYMACCDESYFNDCDLTRTTFKFSNLNKAEFKDCNTNDAYFNHANLSDTEFNEVDSFRTGVLLDAPMQAWAAGIIADNKRPKLVHVEFEIPAGAIVFSINNKLCRTNKAKVVSIETAEGKIIDRAYSTFDIMQYYPGDELNVPEFNLQYNIGVKNGIHFFKTRDDLNLKITKI